MITDIESIEDYMLTDIAVDFRPRVEEWIEGVQEEMNKMTDRQLIADSAAADYKYDGNGGKSMMVDDFVQIVTVKDVTTDITSSCFFYPANKYPKWRIESESSFPKGKQNIVVNGKRGYVAAADVPLDLKHAATVLVAGIINYSNSSAGEVKSESIGRYSVTYSTDTEKVDYDRALETIKRYRRIR